MVFSLYKRQRIVYYYNKGYKPPTISRLLGEEGMRASRKGIGKLIPKYLETGTIRRRPGSGRPTKVTAEFKAIVEEQMRADDEITAVQLHALLKSKGYDISLRTILRCRTSLGWTFRGSAYCQLIRQANKQKWLEWARRYSTESQRQDLFKDVIWSDESSIQLETHRRHSCRKIGERPKNKARYRADIYVHVHVHVIVVE